MRAHVVACEMYLSVWYAVQRRREMLQLLRSFGIRQTAFSNRAADVLNALFSRRGGAYISDIGVYTHAKFSAV